MAFGTYGFVEMLMGFAIYFKEADQFISLIANIAPFWEDSISQSSS